MLENVVTGSTNFNASHMFANLLFVLCGEGLISLREQIFGTRVDPAEWHDQFGPIIEKNI